MQPDVVRNSTENVKGPCMKFTGKGYLQATKAWEAYETGRIEPKYPAACSKFRTQKNLQKIQSSKLLTCIQGCTIGHMVRQNLLTFHVFK